MTHIARITFMTLTLTLTLTACRTPQPVPTPTEPEPTTSSRTSDSLTPSKLEQPDWSSPPPGMPAESGDEARP